MAKQPLEKDSRVVYYAQDKKGPFPALVEKVHPVDKGKSDQPALDLRVYFGAIDGKAHVKTNVPYSLEPLQHRWGPLPSEWKWPEPAVKEAPSGD